MVRKSTAEEKNKEECGKKSKQRQKDQVDISEGVLNDIGIKCTKSWSVSWLHHKNQSPVASAGENNCLKIYSVK
jgi:hypothetical protein